MFWTSKTRVYDYYADCKRKFAHIPECCSELGMYNWYPRIILIVVARRRGISGYNHLNYFHWWESAISIICHTNEFCNGSRLWVCSPLPTKNISLGSFSISLAMNCDPESKYITQHTNELPGIIISAVKDYTSSCERPLWSFYRRQMRSFGPCYDVSSR